MGMKTVCVIESSADLQALRTKKREIPPDTIYFCATSELTDLLSQQRIKHQLLTEEILSPEWGEINTWAKKASLRWFEDQVVADALTVNGLNIGNVFNRPISHALIYRLKNQLLAEHLLRQADFDRIVIFDQYVRKDLRSIKDRSTINEILDRRVTGTGKIVIRAHSCIPSKGGISWKDVSRFPISWLYSLWPQKKSPKYVGMGTLKHLLPLLTHVEEGRYSAFIDESFQFAHYKICRENKIAYFLINSFASSGEKSLLRQKLSSLKRRLKKMSASMNRSPWFVYQGNRVEGIAEALIELLNREGYKRMLQQLACDTLSIGKVKAVILHEDVDASRAAALASRRCAVPVLVLSHGIPPTPGDGSREAAGIGVADTIVNSEFEKEKYIKTGHSPELIHVTGLPRYDSIRQRNLEKTGPESKEKTVLYCPHMLTRVTKRKKGYLGIHTPGAVTRQNSIEVIQACKKIECRLVIKPHANSEDLHLWEELVETSGSQKTELVSHRSDIFDLLAASDLVIATFSTVVIEAMLFDKDVITLNFTGRPDIHPYAERGIALGVYDPKDLKDEIQKCLYDSKTQSLLKRSREREKEYFGGFFDGKNTERAAHFVQLLAEGISSDKAELMIEERVAA